VIANNSALLRAPPGPRRPHVRARHRLRQLCGRGQIAHRVGLVRIAVQEVGLAAATAKSLVFGPLAGTPSSTPRREAVENSASRTRWWDVEHAHWEGSQRKHAAA